jgi:hypothetical protein
MHAASRGGTAPAVSGPSSFGHRHVLRYDEQAELGLLQPNVDVDPVGCTVHIVH